MFSSETISRDMSRNSSSFLLSNPSNLKHVSGEGKSRNSMGSDLFLNQSPVGNTNINMNENEQQQLQGGLGRYRSAPSSFLAALLDSSGTNENSNSNSSSGDESEALFSALMDAPNPKHYPLPLPLPLHMKQELGVESELRPDQMAYESGGAVVGSYSLGMENHHLHLRMNNASATANNLVRQSSSPAGFLNGYGMIGAVENYRVHNHSKATSSGMSNHHMSFSSAPSSTSRFMPSIPENNTRNPENGREFDALFPQDSWINDTTTTPFNNSLKRNRDVFSSFSGLENQNGETTRKRSPHGLVHHLSLPKTASEMAEVEKFLQVQNQNDTIPCQIRAKRGCATHPRSIAERMRRTRISEKMKKLQDLFPNMDKQTSTADMLDLAVQFIKDLQEQVETLTETRAKCVCSKTPQQTAPNL